LGGLYPKDCEQILNRWLIIPCFNEEHRLSAQRIIGYPESLHCNVLLVDDASTDNTEKIINNVVDLSKGTISSIKLPNNVGKGESIRQGFHWVISRGATQVGFVDADGAIDQDDLLALFDALDKNPSRKGIIGSRVALLGHEINRTSGRHLIGRIFATFASFVLKQPVYDTQCGAKVFRVCENFNAVLKSPFSSRWGFDVELLGRLFLQFPNPPKELFLEVPLRRWNDVAGSKVGILDGVRTFIELLKIKIALKKWQRQFR
jgi:glycosyltransferase involved in cell wall biosynthesis